jgi:hypothetical protein
VLAGEIRGYNPRLFNEMVGALGPAEAARQLITSTAPASGFVQLWEHRRLDMTVEALALLPW